MNWFVIATTAPGFVLSLAMLWAAWRTIDALDNLSDVAIEGSETWPTLSFISPACNEEAVIEASLRSVLSGHYPALEVVAIDDRSEDRTGELIDALGDSSQLCRHISPGRFECSADATS